jgi:Conserved hypothetical protein (DUF2461)
MRKAMGHVYFEGFSAEMFHFLNRLSENNSREWIEAHRRDYETLVLRPVKALVSDLGALLRGLNQDFEVEPRVGRTISRITNDLKLHKSLPACNPFLYSCFPRRGHRVSSEPLLAVGVYEHGVSVGFYPGLFNRVRVGRIQEGIKGNQRLFQRYLDERDITGRYWELTRGEDGPVMKWPLPKTARRWVRLESFTVGEYFSASEPVISTRAFLDCARGILFDLYPLWLFAMSDDLKTVYELYRESTAPPARRLTSAAG